MKDLILILFILFCYGIEAQTLKPGVETPNPSSVVQVNLNYAELWRTHFEFTLPENRFVFQKPSSLIFLNTPNHLQGMFCKMEYKIEGKSKLSPRFRLGSLNYTEWMEGKRELYGRY